MLLANCDRCGESRVFTHRVISSCIDMLVCEPCGQAAVLEEERLKDSLAAMGRLTVVRLKGGY